MKTSSCEFSQRLDFLLQDVCALKTKAEIEKNSHTLLLAKLDLGRVHRLIARHRDLCPQCRLNDEKHKSSRRETQGHNSKVIPIDKAG
jgi:hypothetical protein